MHTTARFAARHLALIVAAGLALGSGVARADEADEILARSLADAKALAAKLPGPDRLGPEWLRPWALPAASGRTISEADFWTAFEQQSLPAGITESHAKAMGENAAAQAAQAGIPGFTARVGMINLLRALRGQLGTSAEKALDQADQMIAEHNAAKVMEGRPEAAPQAQQAFFDALAAPYASLDDAGLQRLFVSQTTRVSQRTRMEYLRSNDWEKAKLATPPPGVWVGVVTVTLSIVKDDRIPDVPDILPEHVPALEKKINEGYQALYDTHAPERLKQLRARLESTVGSLEAQSQPRSEGGGESADDRAARMARVESLTRERDELQQKVASLEKPPRVKVLHRQFGDNSYVLRVTGALSEVVGAPVSMYTGWVRNGPALVEVKLGGNFPEAEMDKAMDHFLVEMDANTDVYRQ